jgi:hypothetical protein
MEDFMRLSDALDEDKDTDYESSSPPDDSYNRESFEVESVII